MLDVTEQLRRYGDAVAESVEPVSAADVTTVLVVLAGGAWFAARSSDSLPAGRGVTTGRNTIEVGVATVQIPDGMQLDGSVTSDAVVQTVHARLRTADGVCTITSYRGTSGLRRFTNLEVERFNDELYRASQLRSTLDERVKALNERLASLSAGSSDVASLADQREAALKQIDNANQLAYALGQAGPQRVSVGEGFMPTDAGRTTWRAQATPTEALRISCPDATTAQQLVDATTLPTP